MKNLLLIILIGIICFNVKADIRPYPIQAKGITPNEATKVKMKYEKVEVSLTKENSSVHCYFKMHNEGQAVSMQIGYPDMNYSYWGSEGSSVDPITHLIVTKKIDKVIPFSVKENGKQIEQVKFYTPDSVKRKYDMDRPQYYWDSHFEANETKIIEVFYTLPYGKVKRDLYRKFDYLLSTGAGWKDKIDTAEIIINLIDLDKNLILNITPSNYIIKENQIIWKHYNLEPTLKNDICIKYEEYKGSYDLLLKSNKIPKIAGVFNDTRIISYDVRDSLNMDMLFENIINSKDQLYFIGAKNDAARAKKLFPNLDFPGDVDILYDKEYVINKLNRILNSRFPKQGILKFTSVADFENKYTISVNNVNNELRPNGYDDIARAMDDKFVNITFKHNKYSTKEEIVIELKK